MEPTSLKRPGREGYLLPLVGLVTLLVVFAVTMAFQRMSRLSRHQALDSDSAQVVSLLESGIAEAVGIAFAGPPIEIPDPTDLEAQANWSVEVPTRLAQEKGQSMIATFRFARDVRDINADDDSASILYYDPYMILDGEDNPSASFGGADGFVDNESPIQIGCAACPVSGLPILEATLTARHFDATRRWTIYIGADWLEILPGLGELPYDPSMTLKRLLGFERLDGLTGKITADNRGWRRFLAGADFTIAEWPTQRPVGLVYLEAPGSGALVLRAEHSQPDIPSLLYIEGAVVIEGDWRWKGLVFIDGTMSISGGGHPAIEGACVIKDPSGDIVETLGGLTQIRRANAPAPLSGVITVASDYQALSELSYALALPTLLGRWDGAPPAP